MNVKVINLLRYNPVNEEKEMQEDLKENGYYMMDYFDYVHVENIGGGGTLEDCFGVNHSGKVWEETEITEDAVAYQRYCVYDMEENDGEDFWNYNNTEYPLLTVVQVFVNPDIYQFTQERKLVGYQECKRCIEETLDNECVGKDVKWQIYHLLTAGDFLIAVRSKKVHDAFDISIVVRNIMAKVFCQSGEEKTMAVFTTYSFLGIYQQEDMSKSWSQFLDVHDRIALRFNCTNKYWEHDTACEEMSFDDEEMRKELFAQAHRLYGRYDFGLLCTPAEFAEIYRYILQYKKHGYIEESLSQFQKAGNTTKLFIWLLKKKYILYINERVWMKYTHESICSRTEWKLQTTSSTVVSLYEKNRESVSWAKEKFQCLEEQSRRYYDSAPNIKEYVHIIRKIIQTASNLNQLQESRICVAYLMKQIRSLLESGERFLNLHVEQDKKKVADTVEQYLQKSSQALETFTRYVKNINLQTLQSPNYDLLTEACIEKVLLAYNQLLIPFVKQRGNFSERGYEMSAVYSPLLIPNLGVQDMSVCVIFDIVNQEEKLMIIDTPTFQMLFDPCFLMPIIFHEIAHQFRFENRSERNKVVVSFVVKGIIESAVREILYDENLERVRIEDKDLLEKIVNDVFKVIEGEFECNEDKNLMELQGSLSKKCQKFFEMISNSRMSFFESTVKFVECTKSSILVLNDNVENALEQLNICIQEYLGVIKKQDEEDKGKEIQIRQALYVAVETYYEQLLKELCKELMKSISEIKEIKHFEQMRNYIKVWQDSDDFSVLKNMEFGEKLFEEFNKCACFVENLDREKIVACLKKYHRVTTRYYEDVVITYQMSTQKTDEEWERILSQRKYEKILKELHSSLTKHVKEYDSAMHKKLKWENGSEGTQDVEYLKKWLKIDGEKNVDREMKQFFKHHTTTISEYVRIIVEKYREITSDLFMCSVMDLKPFGYLVVATTYFAFTGDEEKDEVLYERALMVLRCLVFSKMNKQIANEQPCEYMDRIEDMLWRELLTELVVGAQQFGDKDIEEKFGLKKNTEQIFEEKSIREIYEMLEEIYGTLYQRIVDGESDIGLERQWVIKIYYKIVIVIYNMFHLYAQFGTDSISRKVMWNDITGEKSYTSMDKKHKIHSYFLMDSEGGGKWKLYQSIKEMLNSPRKFYREEQNLLENEIEFIFENWEKTCQQIFAE